eukprot:3211373-Rhodomonas_salina.1
MLNANEIKGECHGEGSRVLCRRRQACVPHLPNHVACCSNHAISHHSDSFLPLGSCDGPQASPPVLLHHSSPPPSSLRLGVDCNQADDERILCYG